jgi:hypothetical protein
MGSYHHARLCVLAKRRCRSVARPIVDLSGCSLMVERMIWDHVGFSSSLNIQTRVFLFTHFLQNVI